MEVDGNNIHVYRAAPPSGCCQCSWVTITLGNSNPEVRREVGMMEERLVCLIFFYSLAVNQLGETAFDTAKRLKVAQCEELLSQAAAGKLNPHIHVEYDWNLRLEEIDESDDDLDDKPSPIKKERSPRPQSFCHSSSISPQDKLSLPGFSTPRDKQRLSYGAFTNFMSTSTDSPTSPITDAPPLPPRNAGKGM
ncbi:hypothetical protein GDO78_018939 [Eleutherodactylus coqui]|uniref:Uncharacterized protein n=1 Tax=Eleutherodactylus coqui TaxID=57060 RepID=A0A8J6E7P0_ELECQ|nr:hypothetical protein GDO78_018939 [Eleutherodactylus coqui]